MRKLCTMFAALTLVVLGAILLPNQAQAATVDDLTFTRNSNNTSYSVTGCNESASGALVIPDTYEGASVTGIADGAFSNCDSLVSVTIPDSVISMGSNVFYDCDALTSVTIGNSVTGIGSRTFYDCDALLTITIPDSVTTIGEGAFNGCDNLISATVGNGVTQIGYEAFRGCSNLTSITMGNGVTSIGQYAFYECDRLNRVNISDLAAWCGISFHSKYGTPLTYDADLYLNGKKLTNLVIPDSVTTISANAFKGCTSLTSVSIPNSININARAFEYCDNLTSVTIGDSVITIGADAFYGCEKLSSVKIGNGVINIYEHAFAGCYDLTSVTIGSSVTTIGDGVFLNCDSLVSVTIPDSVISMGSNVFYDCDALTSVTIGNSVTEIASNTFYDCDALLTITIPDSVTTIGEGAFNGCDNLISATVGNGVTRIGYEAFRGCSNLTSITMGNGVTSIGQYAFYGCDRLGTVYYGGTEEDRSEITIGSNNSALTNATWRYVDEKPYYAPEAAIGADGMLSIDIHSDDTFKRVIVFYLGANDSFAGQTNPSWSKLVAEGKKYVAMNGTAGYKTYQAGAELPELTLAGNYAISVKYTNAEGEEKTKWFTPCIEGEAYHAPVVTVDVNGQIGVDVHDEDTFLRVCLFYIGDYEPQKNPGLYSGWLELIKKGKEFKAINGSEGYKIHKDLNNLPQLDDPSNYAILVKYNGADGALRTAYLIP